MYDFRPSVTTIHEVIVMLCLQLLLVSFGVVGFLSPSPDLPSLLFAVRLSFGLLNPTSMRNTHEQRIIHNTDSSCTSLYTSLAFLLPDHYNSKPHSRLLPFQLLLHLKVWTKCEQFSYCVAVINAELAAYRAPQFCTRLERAREMILSDMLTSYGPKV